MNLEKRKPRFSLSIPEKRKRKQHQHPDTEESLSSSSSSSSSFSSSSQSSSCSFELSVSDISTPQNTDLGGARGGEDGMVAKAKETKAEKDRKCCHCTPYEVGSVLVTPVSKELVGVVASTFVSFWLIVEETSKKVLGMKVEADDGKLRKTFEIGETVHRTDELGSSYTIGSFDSEGNLILVEKKQKQKRRRKEEEEEEGRRPTIERVPYFLCVQLNSKMVTGVTSELIIVKTVYTSQGFTKQGDLSILCCSMNQKVKRLSEVKAKYVMLKNSNLYLCPEALEVALLEKNAEERKKKEKLSEAFETKWESEKRKMKAWQERNEKEKTKGKGKEKGKRNKAESLEMELKFQEAEEIESTKERETEEDCETPVSFVFQNKSLVTRNRDEPSLLGAEASLLGAEEEAWFFWEHREFEYRNFNGASYLYLGPPSYLIPLIFLTSAPFAHPCCHLQRTLSQFVMNPQSHSTPMTCSPLDLIKQLRTPSFNSTLPSHPDPPRSVFGKCQDGTWPSAVYQNNLVLELIYAHFDTPEYCSEDLKGDAGETKMDFQVSVQPLTLIRHKIMTWTNIWKLDKYDLKWNQNILQLSQWGARVNYYLSSLKFILQAKAKLQLSHPENLDLEEDVPSVLEWWKESATGTPYLNPHSCSFHKAWSSFLESKMDSHIRLGWFSGPVKQIEFWMREDLQALFASFNLTEITIFQNFHTAHRRAPSGFFDLESQNAELSDTESDLKLCKYICLIAFVPGFADQDTKIVSSTELEIRNFRLAHILGIVRSKID